MIATLPNERTRSLTVRDPKSEPERTRWDLLVCALGYESRSSYVARRLQGEPRKKLAIVFPDRQVVTYGENRAYLEKSNFALLAYRPSSFVDEFLAIIEGTNRELTDSEMNLIVDVSSMSRPMIAQIVIGLARMPGDRPLNVRFTYAPAIFTRPHADVAPVTVSEPVIPEFAGWSSSPERPVSAIVGLGYEYHQALGALEFLEPATAWAFVPFGEDKRYDYAVKNANRDIRNFLNAQQISLYRVDRPFEYFLMLECLVYGLLRDSRPILIPFGPKIFALVSMLIAKIHAPNVTVWRVSGGQATEPADRIAAGKIISLTTTFHRK